MKNFLKHALFVLCVFSMVLGFVGCPQEPEKGSDPVISISIASTGYTAGSFMVGDEATLTATVVNSTKPVIWTVEPAGIVSIPSSGAEIKMLALAKGTAVVTAKVGDKTATFPVVVDVNPATAELKELPWAVTMGKGFGNNDVFTKSIDDAEHGTWYTNNSLINWDGIGYYGAANGYQYYAEYEGVWFNWYASANTEIGNLAGGRLESYMAILKDSLKAAEGKNVKITINAKAILKAENEGDEPLQPRLALYTQDKYVLADTDLTEEAKNYEFVVAPGQQICIGNNGPTGSYMVILGVSAEETDAEAIDQTPSINSVTVTLPAEVQVGGTTSATAEVSVKYNAAKTVEWKSSDEAIATVDTNGNVTGVAAGTATITATSTVDSTKSGSKDITVITGEVKPQVGATYTYWFAKTKTEGAIDCSEKDITVAGASDDGFLTWTDGWNKHGYGFQTAGKGESISIQVAGDVLVGWTGYAGSGKINVTYKDAEGNDVPLLTNVSAANSSDAVYKWFIYKGAETTLTISRSDGTSYFSEITVKPYADEVPSIESMEIEGSGSFVMGDSKDFVVNMKTVYYADETVTWSSSDETVATVDANGKVTAIAAGTATITATSTYDTSKSASKDITVSAEASSINPATVFSYTFDDKKDYKSFASDDGVITIAATGGNQTSGHGAHLSVNDTVTLKVENAVKITLLGCQYGADSTIVVTNSAAEEVGTISWPKGAGCKEETVFEYKGAADTLTLTVTAGGNTYLHGLKVSPLISYEFAADKKDYKSFASDDGVITIAATGGNQTSGHGVHLAVNDTVTLKVGSAVKITLLGCQYGADSTIVVTNSAAEEVGTISWPKGTGCNEETVFEYTGAADTLTLTVTAGGNTYLHGLKITE